MMLVRIRHTPPKTVESEKQQGIHNLQQSNKQSTIKNKQEVNKNPKSTGILVYDEHTNFIDSEWSYQLSRVIKIKFVKNSTCDLGHSPFVNKSKTGLVEIC